MEKMKIKTLVLRLVKSLQMGLIMNMNTQMTMRIIMRMKMKINMTLMAIMIITSKKMKIIMKTLQMKTKKKHIQGKNLLIIHLWLTKRKIVWRRKKKNVISLKIWTVIMTRAQMRKQIFWWIWKWKILQM